MAIRRSSRNKKAVDYSANAATKAQIQAAPKPAKGAVAKTKAKKGRRGLSGQNAPRTDAPLGRVDPASELVGQIYVDDDGEVFDVMLNLVDVAKNHDKYFILQLVECGKAHIVFTRWGRTGTAGSCKTEAFMDLNEAVSLFATKFDQKTGASWEDRENYARTAGKYLWVQKDHVKDRAMWAEAAKWQYWVDDGVDGKADGWYDYDPDGSDVVEQLYHEWTFHAGLHERLVASGAWEYRVDMLAMTQTNAVHAAHKTRHVRRWTAQLGADQTPPAAAVKKDEDVKGAYAAVVPKTPSPQKRKRGAPAAPPPPPAPAAKPSAKAAAVATAVAAAAAAAKPSPSVDPMCTLRGAAVHEDFSAMLNQTNVGANNNKFYRVQLLDANGKFYVWTRWGRVGESGQSALAGAMAEAAAVKAFKAKFKAKTANEWDDRADFEPQGGKYDLVDVEEEEEKPAAAPSPAKKVKREGGTTTSQLDPVTRELVELIFSEDMFKSAMADMELDVKKMPLGALSKAQVQKGYDVLAELEDAVVRGDRQEIERLTGRFYTVIPHSFGRQRPPLIQTEDQVKAKFEMCNVLSDIETAQEMIKEADEAPASQVDPLDEKYSSLHAALSLLPESDPQFKVLQAYCTNTLGGRGMKLRNVWTVDGEKDGAAFTQHSAAMPNHKLLWHGTNVAVVAAILNGGLRIMPHSGGRVGAGIYLASEHAKSACYTCPGRVNGRGSQIGVMFLVQAALGKSMPIQQDNSSYRAAPKGYHSVLAKGRQEPDPKKDTHLDIGGVRVAVPQGKPVKQAASAKSSFSQSEYLVYREAQQRLRYVLTFSYL